MWRDKDTIKTYSDDDVIVKEGDDGTVMYIIVSGEVRVCKLLGDEQVELARLGRGDYFGEMSLLDRSPRSATVTAIGETKVMVLNMGYFMLKIRRDPAFAFSLMVKMSERIRTLNDNLIISLNDDTPKDVRDKIAASEFIAHKTPGNHIE